MTLMFAEIHNTIAYLIKSDVSEGFNQIIDFLNGSSIKYALIVNPNIYVPCIKQFWTSVDVKKVNDVMRVGKGFSGVETPLFEGMIVEQQVANEGGAEVNVDDVLVVGVAAKGVVSATDDKVPTAIEEPSIPSPTPPTPPLQPSQDQPSTSQGGIIANIDADEDVIMEDAKDVVVEKSVDVDESADIQGRIAESQAEIYQIDLEHANKVLSMQDDEESEPAEFQEVVDVVNTAKIITEVVTPVSTTHIVATSKLTTATPLTLTTAARRK
uniref:Xylulose kinase-1 n=1 Tax=Tanacetum cinerariifolium TaxID=118510 RepID=A0A6L2MUA1_TANCI|nr:hypothetical protein [Tanacetum cinerariifolium]